MPPKDGTPCIAGACRGGFGRADPGQPRCDRPATSTDLECAVVVTGSWRRHAAGVTKDGDSDRAPGHLRCHQVTRMVSARLVCGFWQVVAWKGGRLAAQSRSDQGSVSDRALERASRFFAYAKNAPGLCFFAFCKSACLRLRHILVAKSGFAEHSGKMMPCRLWQILVR
jgi:hypothetical protein